MDAVSSATVLFQDARGDLYVTAVVKVTHALRHGTLAAPAPPQPMDEARDLVPCKPRADVVVVGRAEPRRPGPARQVVGFAVARGPDVLLCKRLVAVGCDVPEREPTLVDPDAPDLPAGLGPVVPLAPPARPPVLPDDLDLRRFQCAPPDQQLAPLRGGEQLLLVGLRRDHPAMRCRLPCLHAHARLEGPGARARPVPLAADTLWIDAERGLACVTFRGSVRVAARAEAPALLGASWSVRAGLSPSTNVEEAAGTPRAWSLPREAPRPSPTVDPIALVDESGLAAGGFDWSFDPPRARRVVVVKGTFDLSPDGGKAALSPEQDRLRGDEPEASDADVEIDHASDLAPFKPQADVLLRGTAHAAAGRTTAIVRIALGAVEARLVALGPRSWDPAGIPTPPGPFAPVPLRHEHAFGGPGYAPNPAGTGFVPGTPPPLLEDPDRLIRSRSDRPAPACFAPVSPAWPARRALLGSYDRAWLRERWPHLPRDLDPAFFQAAPPRLRGAHLRGDERFAVEGVRPGGAGFSGALPGLRPRAFAVRRQGDPFEIVLRLDTALFDTDAGRGHLTWRGSFELEGSAGGIERVVVLREELAAPRSLSGIQAHLAALGEPRLAPSAAPADGASAGPVRLSDHLAAAGVTAGAVAAGAFASQAARRAPDPPAPPAPPGKQEVEAWVREGKSLRGRDLSGADLSGIDLSGRDLGGVILARARLAGARLAGAILAGANLADADAPGSVWDEADLGRADLTRARLAGASLVRARLGGAALAGADLTEARLDAVEAAGADLSGADLSRCHAEGARLAKADLTGATLAGAALGGAVLDDAKLLDAKAAGVKLDEASLLDARFEGAILVEASIRKARAQGAVWECADLSRAVLHGADVSGGIFSGARLTGADLGGILGRGATLREADLSQAVLDGADLMQASFDGANLSGASLVGASLYQAEVGEASLSGADLTRAMVAGTKLAR